MTLKTIISGGQPGVDRGHWMLPSRRDFPVVVGVRRVARPEMM